MYFFSIKYPVGLQTKYSNPMQVTYVSRNSNVGFVLEHTIVCFGQVATRTFKTGSVLSKKSFVFVDTCSDPGLANRILGS